MFIPRRTSRLARASVATGAAALAALAAVPNAQAAFSRYPAPCSGVQITAGGASFQEPAQNGLWRPTAYPNFCDQFGGVGGSGIAQYPQSGTYSGSGAGRRIMGERTGSGSWNNSTGAFSRNPPNGARVGFSDEAPDPTRKVNEIERGTDAEGDEGDLRTIPVAVGAVATIVHLPNDCGVAAVAATNRSADGRIRFTKSQLDKIWASDEDADQWSEVLPGAVGDGCDDPIIRVPRFDVGGTTFVYKEYLHVANTARGWTTTVNTPDNRAWPQQSKSLDTDGAGPGTATVATLQRGASNGNGAMATKVDSTPGSIGYPELATARSSGFGFDSAGDRKYWIEAQNGNANEWTSPDRFGPTSTSDRGANCQNVVFQNVPGSPGDPNATLADWHLTTGINTAAAGAYGICSLTYGLAFDDSSDAYGNTDAEESKARTVKDYLAAVERFGQSGLTAVDQSPLPADIRSRARAGIEAMGWCKDGCGQSTGQETSGAGSSSTATTTTTPAAAAAQVAPPAPPAIVQISNLFSIRSVRTRGSDLLVTLRLPGAGRAVVMATTTSKRRINRRTRTRRFTYARGTVQVSRAGDVSVRIARSKRATSELKRAIGKRGQTLVKVRFEPTGGQAREQSFSRPISVRFSRR